MFVFDSRVNKIQSIDYNALLTKLGVTELEITWIDSSGNKCPGLLEAGGKFRRRNQVIYLLICNEVTLGAFASKFEAENARDEHSKTYSFSKAAYFITEFELGLMPQ